MNVCMNKKKQRVQEKNKKGFAGNWERKWERMESDECKQRDAWDAWDGMR